MDERESGRIEIELTETQPPRWASGRAAGDPNPPAGPVPPAPPGARQPPLVDARWKTAAIAALVGIGGLFVGWAAGASGDGDRLAAPPAATTADTDAPETTEAGFGDDPALVEPEAAEITADSDPEPTTTTDPPVEIEPIELDPRLAGLPYELVLPGRLGGVRYLDLATSMLTTVEGSRRSESGALLTGSGWTLIQSTSSGAWRLWRDGSTEAEATQFDQFGLTLMNWADTSTVWTGTEVYYYGTGGELVEQTPDGTPTGRSIAVDGRALGFDINGVLLVAAPGGVYAVAPDGTTSRLTPGTLLAYSATAVLAKECDEALTCSMVVTDRTTGERRTLPWSSDMWPADLAFRWGGIPQVPNVSPDGRLAAVTLTRIEPEDEGSFSTHTQFVVIDLFTGETTVVADDSQPFDGGSWSDDSRFLFTMVGGTLEAFEASTRELIPVADSVFVSSQSFPSFGVRPSPSTGEPPTPTTTVGGASEGDGAAGAGTTAVP